MMPIWNTGRGRFLFFRTVPTAARHADLTAPAPPGSCGGATGRSPFLPGHCSNRTATRRTRRRRRWRRWRRRAWQHRAAARRRRPRAKAGRATCGRSSTAAASVSAGTASFLQSAQSELRRIDRPADFRMRTGCVPRRFSSATTISCPTRSRHVEAMGEARRGASGFMSSANVPVPEPVDSRSGISDGHLGLLAARLPKSPDTGRRRYCRSGRRH